MYNNKDLKHSTTTKAHNQANTDKTKWVQDLTSHKWQSFFFFNQKLFHNVQPKKKQ